MMSATAERMQSGVADGARALLVDADFIDLHIDAFIVVRALGYDIGRTHPLRLGGRFFGHVDLPRAKQGGLTGGLWSITTNPLRTERGRLAALQRNVARLFELVGELATQARIVTTATAYDDAKRAGVHAIIPVVQGANCLGPALSFREALGADRIVSATLVHLVSTEHGETSTPVLSALGPKGLTERGRHVIRTMDAEGVLLDLAHASPRTFWAALAAHDQSKPVLVTHTGVRAVRDMWRNLDDAQIRAIATTGGCIGVIFQSSFLRRPGGPDGVEMVMEHLAHVVDVGGEDAAAIGTDYDGAIVPPRGLEDARQLPRLVEAMLARGWSESRMRKILGGNFLRCLRAVRP
jgi:membrane dipeptidase